MYPVVISLCQEFVMSLTQNLKKTSSKKKETFKKQRNKIEDDRTQKIARCSCSCVRCKG